MNFLKKELLPFKNSPHFKGTDQEFEIFLEHLKCSISSDVLDQFIQFWISLNYVQNNSIVNSSNDEGPIRKIVIHGKIWELLLEMKDKYFAESKWEAAVITINHYGSLGYEIFGRLDQLSVRDPSLSTIRSASSLFTQDASTMETIVSTEDGKILEFSYNTKLSEEERAMDSKVTSIFRMRVNGLSINYRPAFFSLMKFYFLEIKTISSKLSTHLPSLPRMKFEFMLKNSNLFLNSQEEERDFIVVKLDSVYFFNKVILFPKKEN